MPGIGKRLDGWPNRDLNVGEIISLSPALTADQKKVYTSWGPGKYDPRYNQDGKNTPLVIAAGVRSGERQERDVHRRGADLLLERLRGGDADGRAGQLFRPAAQDRREALAGPGDAQTTGTARVPAQPAAPKPPAGSLDEAAAARGTAVFDKACASCHVGGNGTDNNTGKLHQPDETGMDGAYAKRTTNSSYRTTPLRGLWQHPPYFHDGSAKTLNDVVDHYDKERTLKLTTKEKTDLVEYLKTL